MREGWNYDPQSLFKNPGHFLPFFLGEIRIGGVLLQKHTINQIRKHIVAHEGGINFSKPLSMK